MLIKILYAEDEVTLRNAVSKMLELQGYTVTAVENGQQAIDKCAEHLYDVIVLDIMMPVVDGITALQTIRANQVLTPVILLSAKSQLDDKLTGMENGADDYITKPFEMKELIARIECQHRRNKNYKSQTIKFGNITLDRINGKVFTSEDSMAVDVIEAEILKLLVRVDGKVSIAEIAEKLSEPSECIRFKLITLQQKLGFLTAAVSIQTDNEYASIIYAETTR